MELRELADGQWSPCGGVTGDCVVLATSPTLTAPGEPPRLLLSDMAETFPAHDVAPHEIAQLVRAYAKTIGARYGAEAVLALAGGPEDLIDPEIMDIIEADEIYANAQRDYAAAQRNPEG